MQQEPYKISLIPKDNVLPQAHFYRKIKIVSGQDVVKIKESQMKFKVSKW